MPTDTTSIADAARSCAQGWASEAREPFHPWTGPISAREAAYLSRGVLGRDAREDELVLFGQVFRAEYDACMEQARARV
jgi:hypothetical protein